MAVAPHTPVVLLSAVVGSGVAVFVWVYRDAPGAKPLVAFMVGASVWALAEGVALASPALSGKVFWTKVAWSASPVVPLAWLVTVLSYADSEWQLTRGRLAALCVEPLVFLGLVWTNGTHGLVWSALATEPATGYVVLTREFGLAFWAHTAYSYALVLVGAVVLVEVAYNTSRKFRSQATALLVAVCVPMVANGLSAFKLVAPELDLTSIGFVVTGLVVAVALLREELLSVAPVTRELGREAVVEEVDDPVLIVDDDDRVVDLNPAAERLFGADTGSVVGGDLAAVSESLAGAIRGVKTGQVDVEFDVGGGGVRYFDVRVSSLRRAYGAVTGRVISLRDVTDRRQREQRLDVLNRLLRHNLRNEMNVVRGNAELLRHHLDTDDPEVDRRLSQVQETVDAVVERSDKVGHLSDGLDAQTDWTGDLATVVADATSQLASDGSVTLEVDVPDGVTVVGGPPLERAVAELVDNAVEHGGKAPTVEVSATVTGDAVELRVADDGPGIARQERVVIEEGRETALEHGSGVGLWLVRWVVHERGGTVSFEDREDGTTVVVGLPVVDGERPTRPVGTGEPG